MEVKLKHILVVVVGFVLNNSKISANLKRTHRTFPTIVTAPTTTSAPNPSTSLFNDLSTQSRSTAWLSPELQMLRKLYDDCVVKGDFMDCLKLKALNGLTRAINQDTVKLFDGVMLEKQNHTETQSIIGILGDERSFNNLPALDRNLLSKVDKLVRTHTLKMDMVTGRGKGGGGGGGGGGDKKDKKKGDNGIKYVIAAMLTAMGIAGPIGLKALAAIAVKALVVSKVALTIATIIALKKLFSQDHQEETSVQVHAGDHNRRNTYVIRSIPQKAGGAAVGYVDAQQTDPYRYYYEYH